MMGVDARELAEVVALEHELLEPLVRRSRPRLEALLSEDFTEVGASGRSWTRATVVEALLAERADGPSPVVDVRAVALGEEVVLVTYLSDPAARPARRTSVWHRRDGVWRLRHHQGTPLPRRTEEPAVDGASTHPHGQGADETKSGAVRQALRERLARLREESAHDDLEAAVRRLLAEEIWPQVPPEVRDSPLSKLEEERVLGYGPEGV